MKYSKIAWGVMALVAGLGLGACGGGGGSSASAKNTTVGVITGFGSIYANGCEYETDSASISVDGNSATENDLKVGDVVEITGPANCTKATASAIKSADELEGWVDSTSITNGEGTLVVMGQTVTVTSMTAFEDDSGTSPAITLDTITADNVVEVHGFTTDQGITATRVEVKAVSLTGYAGSIELKGLIKNLDTPVAGSFDIGSLTIDYTTLSPSFSLSNDLFVEVKFDNSKNPISIEVEDDGMIGYQGDDDEEIEIKGMLTQELNGDVFYVGEQKVQVTNNTEFEEADQGQPDLQTRIADAANVTNLYLEVEGHFENQVLIAESVEFEDDISDNSECTGAVSNLSIQAGENNVGTLTVTPSVGTCNGQSSVDISVNNNTMMEDDSVMNDSKFNLTGLQNNETVEVQFDPATMIAIKLERK